MCRFLFGKMCDERTLGEKFLAALTLIMTIAFIITCVMFAICTYEEQLTNYGFENDIDIIDPNEDTNMTRSGYSNYQRILSALILLEDEDVNFLCNINMIAKNWYMTTAHCLKKVEDPKNTSHLVIRSGVDDYKDYGIDRKVERIISHPLYNDNDFSSNIGLVKVDSFSDISYGNYPYELLYDKNPRFTKNDIINVHGWGKNNYNEAVEDSKLRAVQFYLISKDDCRTATVNINRLFANQICGYQLEPDSETCYPSEGAGVIRNGQLIAMSSWGERCIKKSIPHVFAKVDVHIPWIFEYVLEE